MRQIRVGRLVLYGWVERDPVARVRGAAIIAGWAASGLALAGRLPLEWGMLGFACMTLWSVLEVHRRGRGAP